MVIFITYVAVQHCVFRGTNVALVLFALRTLNHLQVPLLLRALCLTACRKFKHFFFLMISLSTVMKAASGRARSPFYYSDANSVSSSELMVSKSFLPFEIGLT